MAGRCGSVSCSAGCGGGGSELCTAADGTLFISIDFQLITFNLLNRGGCRRDSREERRGRSLRTGGGSGTSRPGWGCQGDPKGEVCGLRNTPTGHTVVIYLGNVHFSGEITGRPCSIPRGARQPPRREMGRFSLLKKDRRDNTKIPRRNLAKGPLFPQHPMPEPSHNPLG